MRQSWQPHRHTPRAAAPIAASTFAATATPPPGTPAQTGAHTPPASSPTGIPILHPSSLYVAHPPWSGTSPGWDTPAANAVRGQPGGGCPRTPPPPATTVGSPHDSSAATTRAYSRGDARPQVPAEGVPRQGVSARHHQQRRGRKVAAEDSSDSGNHRVPLGVASASRQGHPHRSGGGGPPGVTPDATANQPPSNGGEDARVPSMKGGGQHTRVDGKGRVDGVTRVRGEVDARQPPDHGGQCGGAQHHVIDEPKAGGAVSPLVMPPTTPPYRHTGARGAVSCTGPDLPSCPPPPGASLPKSSPTAFPPSP